MPILHIRNVPAKMYARIKSSAEKERRSLNAEALRILEEGLTAVETRALRAETLRLIEAQRRKLRGPKAIDTTRLIRDEVQTILRDGDSRAV